MSDGAGQGKVTSNAPGVVRALSGRAAGPGIPRSPLVSSRSATPEQHEDSAGRPLRPTEVYAAAKAVLHQGPAAIGISTRGPGRAGGHETPTASPRRGASSSGLFQRPTGMALASFSPQTGAPLTPSSPMKRTPSFTRRDSAHSILAYGEEAGGAMARHGALPSNGIQGSALQPTSARKTVSAPDSQSFILAQGPWGQQPAHDLCLLMEGAALDSPRKLHQQMAARLLGIAATGSPSSSSPATSSPSTPRDGGLKPRPPGDSVAPGHRRRPSKELLLHPASQHRSESSRDTNSSATGSPALDSRPRSPPNGSEALSVSSPRNTISRQASARNRGIQTLFDAIRSKSDAKLQDALDGFKQNGVYLGLDERHLVTGRTALHEAVAMNNIPMAKILLKAGADPNVGNAQTGPPLLHAAQHGEVGMVELLLSGGADISAKDMAGSSPLHEACAAGHTGTARVLISYGASLHLQNNDGELPLDRVSDEEMKEELTAAAAAAHHQPASGMLARPSIDPPSPSKMVSRLKGAVGSALSSPGRLQLLSGNNVQTGLPRSPKAVAAAAAAGQKAPGAAATAGDRSRLNSASYNVALSTQPSPRQQSQQQHEQGVAPETFMGVAKLRLGPQAKRDFPPSEASTPTSNLDSNDTDCKRSLSPPPQLELPNRVFRREPSRGVGPSDISNAFIEEDAELLQRQRRTVALIFGSHEGETPPSPPPQQQPVGAERPSPDPAWRSPHFAALAAAVPITPKIRFGCDVMEHPLTASPWPTTADDPFEVSSGSAIGSAITAAAACATPGGSSQDGPGGAAAAHGSGVSTPLPPPLVRDASPVRGGGSRGSMDAGGTGAAAPRSVTATLRGRQDMLRISQAAQALVASAGLSTSTEALQAHAIAMFKRSAEFQTGSIAWTRGELLGEGAFGKVYAGLNQMTGELMAVKAMDLLNRKGHNMHAQLEELQQELNLYKNLSHEHVVAYIDSQFDERTSTLYIFLEYVPGGSIASMVKRFGKFNEELVRNYTRQLLLGLEYLHRRKIVHRDIKGGNVLVTRDGIIKLADFGCSKVNQAGTITDGLKSLRGSVFWMAPEVIQQTGYGRRADIWSLGCTVLEMLTGKHPWPDIDNQLSAMFQIVQRTSGPPRPEHCSDLALDFLDQCFKHDANERPTATELLQHPFVCPPEVARRFEAAGGKDVKRSI